MTMTMTQTVQPVQTMQTVPIETKAIETPWSTAGTDDDVAFWRDYLANRPTPSHGFFKLILDYQERQGDYWRALAHDVGTGSGIIAARLAKYFDHVVGSDPNAKSLAVAPKLMPADIYQRLTLVQAPAETLASGVVPAEKGVGKTDLVVVSECIPLLDQTKALNAFHALLRPGGTLAIYFYGRPIFVDGDEKCNEIYDRIASRTCQFLGPFKNSPSLVFHQRAASTMHSWLDGIELPSSAWKNVERHKWNSNRPLLMNSTDAYDFEVEKVDRRGHGEITRDVIDHTFWQDSWDVHRVAACVRAMYPNAPSKAGAKYVEIENMLKELEVAMNGVRRVTFPVALILATKI